MCALQVMRPTCDMWLTSVCTRILDGECSYALAQRLGWLQPIPLTHLAAQLLELGKMHAKACHLYGLCLAAFAALFPQVLPRTFG